MESILTGFNSNESQVNDNSSFSINSEDSKPLIDSIPSNLSHFTATNSNFVPPATETSDNLNSTESKEKFELVSNQSNELLDVPMDSDSSNSPLTKSSKRNRIKSAKLLDMESSDQELENTLTTSSRMSKPSMNSTRSQSPGDFIQVEDRLKRESSESLPPVASTSNSSSLESSNDFLSRSGKSLSPSTIRRPTHQPSLESLHEKHKAKVAAGFSNWDRTTASPQNLPNLSSSTNNPTHNTSIEYYYWDAEKTTLVQLPSTDINEAPNGSEILMFPIGSFRGPILPSDHKHRHEFIRNQRCVKYCDYDFTDVAKKSPVRLREHVLNCGHRKLFFGNSVDPMARLCELQLRALRTENRAREEKEAALRADPNYTAPPPPRARSTGSPQMHYQQPQRPTQPYMIPSVLLPGGQTAPIITAARAPDLTASGTYNKRSKVISPNYYPQPNYDMHGNVISSASNTQSATTSPHQQPQSNSNGFDSNQPQPSEPSASTTSPTPIPQGQILPQSTNAQLSQTGAPRASSFPSPHSSSIQPTTSNINPIESADSTIITSDTSSVIVPSNNPTTLSQPQPQFVSVAAIDPVLLRMAAKGIIETPTSKTTPLNYILTEKGRNEQEARRELLLTQNNERRNSAAAASASANLDSTSSTNKRRASIDVPVLDAKKSKTSPSTSTSSNNSPIIKSPILPTPAKIVSQPMSLNLSSLSNNNNNENDNLSGEGGDTNRSSSVSDVDGSETAQGETEANDTGTPGGGDSEVDKPREGRRPRPLVKRLPLPVVVKKKAPLRKRAKSESPEELIPNFEVLVHEDASLVPIVYTRKAVHDFPVRIRPRSIQHSTTYPITDSKSTSTTSKPKIISSYLFALPSNLRSTPGVQLEISLYSRKKEFDLVSRMCDLNEDLRGAVVYEDLHFSWETQSHLDHLRKEREYYDEGMVSE